MGTWVHNEKAMKYVICRQGETQPGVTTVTFERNGLTLVVKNVPARVCVNCGEEYLDEQIAAKLLETADNEAQVGVLADIRAYVLA